MNKGIWIVVRSCRIAIVIVFFAARAPAQQNVITALTAAARPMFSPVDGTYRTAQIVSISDATSGATIYYTTDGTTPTTASIQYVGAITVSSTETLKAIAMATGDSQSATASAIYTIFTTPNRTVSTLYSFDSNDDTDGQNANGLIQGSDGNFYGTTAGGGLEYGECTFGNYGCGTVFKITPTGVETVLHYFTDNSIGIADGAYPTAGLIEGSDGNLYGTTQTGGAYYAGTVFKMTNFFPVGSSSNSSSSSIVERTRQ
jgi:uncharacterized repeat protein (TIGR03803 family)